MNRTSAKLAVCWNVRLIFCCLYSFLSMFDWFFWFFLEFVFSDNQSAVCSRRQENDVPTNSRSTRSPKKLGLSDGRSAVFEVEEILSEYLWVLPKQCFVAAEREKRLTHDVAGVWKELPGQSFQPFECLKYEVKWKGYCTSENTFEPKRSFKHSQHLLGQWAAKQKKKKKTQKNSCNLIYTRRVLFL